MRTLNKLMTGKLTRRTFLNSLGKAAILSALLPNFGCSQPAKKETEDVAQPAAPQNWKPSPRTPKVVVRDITPNRILLKNGLVVDGSGQKAFYGDVLVNADRIEQVTPREVSYSGRSVDCTGKVIAPGFIDMHSHMDWVLPIKDHPELKTPFTAQGVTSFVTGNCGFGVAAFRPDSPFRKMLEARTVGLYNLQWNSMAEYFDYLGRHGITHNLVNLVGHGTTRTSIRGFDPTPLNQDEMTEMLTLLEEAIYKMTGASADRFQIRDRGRLTPGSFADITVFDWQNIKDNNNAVTTDNPPTGIDAVFINGKQVLAGKTVDENSSPGRVL